MACTTCDLYEEVYAHRYLHVWWKSLKKAQHIVDVENVVDVNLDWDWGNDAVTIQILCKCLNHPKVIFSLNSFTNDNINNRMTMMMKANWQSHINKSRTKWQRSVTTTLNLHLLLNFHIFKLSNAVNFFSSWPTLNDVISPPWNR